MKFLLLIVAVLPFITCQPGSEQPYDADVNNEFVVFAVKAINDQYQSGGDNRVRVVERVVTATQQVVAGMLYRFKLEISGGDANELCSVSVLSQPWLPVETTLLGAPVCVSE